MSRLSTLAGGAAIALVLLLPAQVAAGHPRFSPGAPGVGDPYFPLDGNGGYDVTHYDLGVSTTPQPRRSTASRRSPRATQNLSAFNFDLVGLNVRSITVDGSRAFAGTGQELTITPRGRYPKASVRRDALRGDPPARRTSLGRTALRHRGRRGGRGRAAGAAAGTRSTTTRRQGGVLLPHHRARGAPGGGQRRPQGSPGRRGWTTWPWDAPDPMASYLVAVDIGEFDFHAYRRRDAVRRRDRSRPFYQARSPARPARSSRILGGRHGGVQAAIPRSTCRRAADRWLRSRPRHRTELGLLLRRGHTVGADNWTTLPDDNGHRSDDPGLFCPSGTRTCTRSSPTTRA